MKTADTEISMTMQCRKPARMGLLTTLVALALAATACGASTTAVEGTTSAEPAAQPAIEQAAEPDPTATAEPTAVPEPTAEPEPTAVAEPSPTPEPAFTSAWGSVVNAGDCLIRAEGNPAFVAPEIVPCDELHEEEVYATSTLDISLDEPFPGEDELVELVATELCDDATIDFAGEPWDALAMATYVLYPSQEEWDAGDRWVACSAGSHDEQAFKIGTAAGGTIDTDDALIVRSSITSDGETWEDWLVVSEGATLDNAGSLTDGQFDMPPRRPFPVDRGFVFNAYPFSGDPSETVTWGYSWEDRAFTDLGSVLPGQIIEGTMIANDHIVFTARESDGDDRDLWITEDGEARVLAGGDGGQGFATFAPGFERVVYVDGGDLWIIDVDGSNAQQLTTGFSVFESAVSPDGDTIVFASNRSGDDELWSISIDGGDAVNLTNHPGDDTWPVFSADGRYIYFSTDRLDPEDDQLRLMVMEADGSNPSWFSVMQASQAMLLDSEVVDQVIAETPTLDERFNYTLIEGADPSELVTYEHSSGRLNVGLPPGWRVGEFDEITGLVAGPRPGLFFDVWEVDGIDLSLYDGDTEEDFFARYQSTAAVEGCNRVDGTDGIVEAEDGTRFQAGEFNCGNEGVTAAVFAFYDPSDGVGLVIEAQRDNLPDIDSDTDLLTAIVQSVTWQ